MEPSTPSRRQKPHKVHLNYCIHRDAYDLLLAECPVTPTGRKVGMAQALEKCIYAFLGGKKIQQEQENP